jgi:hypothetical protein
LYHSSQVGTRTKQNTDPTSSLKLAFSGLAFEHDACNVLISPASAASIHALPDDVVAVFAEGDFGRSAALGLFGRLTAGLLAI